MSIGYVCNSIFIICPQRETNYCNKKIQKCLLENGYDIELIPPIRIEGVRTPDITMRGVAWEMKAPSGDGKNTIRHIVRRQAESV